MKKNRAKRTTTLLLALVLLVGLCPIAPKAEAVTVAETCPCCGVPVSEIDWYGLSGDISGDYIDAGDHYRLVDDSAYIDTYCYVYGEMTIDLNGYEFGAGCNDYIEVFSTLHLMDLSQTGTGCFVGNISVHSGELNLYSGSIVGYDERRPIFVAEGSTLNVYGGEITGGYLCGASGGNIYNCGTVNIYGGIISNGYLYECWDSEEGGGNIYNAGTVNMSGGIITGGRVGYSCGGNVHNTGTFNLTGGIISDGVVCNDLGETYGGNIYNDGELNICGGTVSGGSFYFYDDWYIWDAVYSGSNIYNNRTMNVYGGTITSDESSDLRVSSRATLTVYAGRYEGRTNLTPYIADCSCYTTDAEGYTVVNAGYEDGSCIDCSYAQMVEAGLVEHVPGSHAYEPYGVSDKKCSICGKIVITPNCHCCGKLVSEINWITCSGSGSTNFSQDGHYKLTGNVTLTKEHTITADVTLDLNGYTLQAASGSRGFTVKNGGELTLINTGGSNGRLIGKNTTADGGTIYVEKGGTLNLYSGRVVGTTVSGKAGGAIFNAGTLKIFGGTVEGGTAKNGGNIFTQGEFWMENGLVTGGMVVGDGGYGGNIYNTKQMTIKGGTVENGISHEHGGNIYCANASVNHIYGGLISNGKVVGDGDAIFGHGGNIYVTGKSNQFHMYGGTVTGGQNLSKGRGGNLVFNSGVQGYIHGGTIENGAASKGDNVSVIGSNTTDGVIQYSSLYILGGTFIAAEAGDFEKDEDHKIEIYSCRYNGTTDILPWIADCCCYEKTDTGYTIWNKGYGSCTDCLYDQARAEDLVEVINGSHTYENVSENTYVCTVCGERERLENMGAIVGGKIYDSLEDAIYAAGEDEVVQMCCDADVFELYLGGVIMDLNGYTLTAEYVTGTPGSIIDTSSRNTGKVFCDDITLDEYNRNLPVNYEGGIHFCPVDFTQWVETVDENTTKVKFYITQRSNETILDDAINSGNTQVNVQIHLTWTDKDGNDREKTMVFGQELLQKYAEKWNGRVFVTTITGTSGITNLQVTYQVTSEATSGVTVPAKLVKVPVYIKDKLSWDKINAFPIKTSDMTVEEMRQLCVEFMEFNKTFLWTPDQDVKFVKNASGTDDQMNAGATYGGLPYVGVATGNPYRMMDYVNEYGILDVQKALPMLGTKDRLEMADLKYFGNQCSICVYWGWGRVMNSAAYKWTSSVVPNNNFILLGDIQIDETIKSWSAAYNTKIACQANKTDIMYAAYAALQKADGMVNYVETTGGDGAGHLVMAYDDAYVAYNPDGSINGEESYVLIIDQAQTWETDTNEQGDTFQRKNSVGAKKTFQSLYNSGYIPFTFAEFLGTDAIELTQVSLVKGDETLVNGTVSEADRSFAATQTTANLNWSDLMASNITSNYGIVDAYIIIKNARGEEVYKHAVRTATAGNMKLSLEEEGAMVTTWGKLPASGTYSAEIVIQLATGERPTVWNGQLTCDK